MPIPCMKEDMRGDRSCQYMHCLTMVFGDATDRTAEAETAPPKAGPLKASSKLALPVFPKRCLYDSPCTVQPILIIYESASTALFTFAVHCLFRPPSQRGSAPLWLHKFHTFRWPLQTSNLYSNQATNNAFFAHSQWSRFITYQSLEKGGILSNLAEQCRPTKEIACLALWRIVSPSQQLPTVRTSAPNLLRLIMLRQQAHGRTKSRPRSLLIRSQA